MCGFLFQAPIAFLTPSYIINRMQHEIFLHNTLTSKKELFVPLKPNEVSIYNCGPTVHNYAHIGNLRTYVFADILKRVFLFNGYKVMQVMNITDVGHLTSDADQGEDKLATALKKAGKPLSLEAMRELANFYTEKFMDDLKALNVDTSSIIFPKASEHIQDQIDLIKKLEANGLTYNTSDGVYFDTGKIDDYGKLGQIPKPDESESRIGLNKEKKNPTDFALWKFSKDIGWDSAWGKGFPGWHIECSAMSMKYLGQTFDIHTGGTDHIPTHHNNEIAQSEHATGNEFVRYWLHSAFLTIDDSKMAKSAGNFTVLSDLTTHIVSPLAFRYWLLTAHYRTQVNFTWEAVSAAQTALFRLVEQYIELGQETGMPDGAYIERFREMVNDDLDMPKAVALAWELMKDKKITNVDKKATLLQFDEVFGFRLKDVALQFAQTEIPAEVTALAEARKEAREAKEWNKADALRKEIEARGYIVKDTEKGFEIREM